MTLPGDHHHVPGIGPGDRIRDRGPAVDLVLNIIAGTNQDLADDPLGILGSRIVRGDYHAISQAPSDLAHQRALATIPVTAAAEDDVDASAGELARRLQDVLK